MIDDSMAADVIEKLFYVFNHWMNHRFKDFIQNNSDITLNQYRVLNILKKYDYIKMSDLSELLNITSGSLTIMIDRLIDKNFVYRSFSTEDRRIVLVNITESGKNIVVEFRKGFIKLLENDMEKLSENDKGIIHKAAKQLKHIIDNNFI